MHELTKTLYSALHVSRLPSTSCCILRSQLKQSKSNPSSAQNLRVADRSVSVSVKLLMNRVSRKRSLGGVVDESNGKGGVADESNGKGAFC
jgi:hypothetical protein